MRTNLEAAPRAKVSGGELNRMRREGFIPASISTRGEETEHCSVSRSTLSEILGRHGVSALIELQRPGHAGGLLVIARDIQTNPISGKLIHVGFQSVSSREPITAEVRLVLQGEPMAVRHGTGTLEQITNSLLVRAMPDKLPSQVVIDATALEIGNVVQLSAIAGNKDYEFVAAPDTVIAVLHGTARAVAERQEEATASEAAAPEEPPA